MLQPFLVQPPLTGAGRFDAREPVSPEALAARARLIGRLEEIWAFGRNALVGWYPVDHGVLVLAAPVVAVLEKCGDWPRLIEGARMMDRGTIDVLSRALGVAPVTIPTEDALGAGDALAMCGALEAAFRPYCVTMTRQRAVCQVDISEFSLFSPEEQAAQLSMLGYSLNIANQKLLECGIDIDLACSTTGDGFYVWNRREGLDADVNLFCLMMVALAHQALPQRGVRDRFMPTIRTCFGVGSHYNYFRPDPSNGIGADYIVGDITIGLARLIDAAGPNQILMADFRHDQGDGRGQRRDRRYDRRQDGDGLPTDRFLEVAGRTLDHLQFIRIDDEAITRISRYLTGPKKEDGSFAIRRRRIVDKHGRSHFAYNAKVNIFLGDRNPIFLGMPETRAP